MSILYDFTVKDRTGKDVSLKDFEGKLVLVVNTATGCGFTPHYDPLEAMYKDLKDKGFEILDFPCNQFADQAPGSDDEIHEFCTMHFNTTFPQMRKAEVNGENELPLYTYLKSEKGFAGFDEHPFKELLEKMFSEADSEWDKKPDIKWNFTKFIIDREGNVVARFEPTADMAQVEACVKSLL
jgi:glutathione peroxidase